MRTLAIVCSCVALFCPIDLAQDHPHPTSLIHVLAAPEKFDGRIVTVVGYLSSIGDHPEFVGQQPILYIHEEDAKNLLMGNSVLVQPSPSMIRESEKINLMYITITGMFRASRLGGDYEGGTISDVEAYSVWSNPNRPIGLQKVPGKYK